MLGIATHNLPLLKQYLIDIDSKGNDIIDILASLQSGNDQQVDWGNMRSDIENMCGAFRIAEKLIETIELERGEKIDYFNSVKTLELMNDELCQENKRLISLIEDMEEQKDLSERMLFEFQNKLKMQTNKHEGEWTQCLKAQLQKQRTVYDFKIKLLEAELNSNQTKISQLQNELQTVNEELSLQIIQNQLAVLVIDDLKNKTIKVDLEKDFETRSTFSPRTIRLQRSQVSIQFQNKPSRRHNSLHQDLVQSHIFFQPQLSSHIFKSAETIPEIEQDKERNYRSIHQLSIRSNLSSRPVKKCSKAVTVKLQMPKESNDLGIQTDSHKTISRYSQIYDSIKNMLVTRRIKK